jgi:hypothetical protein
MKIGKIPTLVTSIASIMQFNGERYRKSKLSGTFTVTKRWTDSKGNIWTKLNYSIPEYNTKGYELMKLNKAGTILEGVFSQKHYPTEIDPNAPGYYLSYYHR